LLDGRTADVSIVKYGVGGPSVGSRFRHDAHSLNQWTLPWLSHARRLGAIMRFEGRAYTAVIIFSSGPRILVLRLLVPQLVDDVAE
jgi:hypothetical protein